MFDTTIPVDPKKLHRCASVLAHQRALQHVKHAIRARGDKVQHYTYRDLVTGADAYLTQHPELAVQMVWRVLEIPELRKLVVIRRRRRTGHTPSQSATSPAPTPAQDPIVSQGVIACKAL